MLEKEKWGGGWRRRARSGDLESREKGREMEGERGRKRAKEEGRGKKRQRKERGRKATR